jgi:GntR family transcriptional regulator
MGASTKSRQPPGARYREIETFLRSLVDKGRPGDALPTEAELCERFSVSRMTVRQALQELTNDGVVERRRGQGTFVRHRPVHRRPGVFLSFTEEMHRRGMQPTSRLLQASLETPRPVETSSLGVSQSDQVVRILRVRLADGIAVAIEEATLVPRLADVLDEDLGAGSLHAALAKRGIVAVRATGTITARLARASETQLLDLPPHAALLVEVRVLFDQEGQVFERTETRYVADRYVIDVEHSHP